MNYEAILLPLAFALSNALGLLLGYVLDRCFGDPAKLHPIIGFGNLIAWGEKRFNNGNNKAHKGMIYNCSLIVAVGLIGLLLEYASILVPLHYGGLYLAVGVGLVIRAVVIFYMISGTTLIKEVRAVFYALDRSLEEGRRQVGRIVGRDTQELSREEVQTAALETLSENLSDGVIAPLFWYAIFGLPAILMYKMINTQDSMIGYKTDRYLEYGRFSALTDDLVNFLPARITAWLMLLVSRKLNLWPFVLKYGCQHASPNSGYPEAALAGILDCRFGGTHNYFGQEFYKPYIGENPRTLTTEDAQRAIGVNRRTEAIMIPLCIIIGDLFKWITVFYFIL